MSKEKIKPHSEIALIAVQLKKLNKKIITANGVFDILHVGHIRYLQQAKSLGDALIVLINSDSSVRKLKGPQRPLNTQTDRAEALAALACVDYVAVFGDDTPEKILELIRPTVHVKGGDYKLEQIVEREVVEKYGGTVAVLPLEKGYSTTILIQKICGRYGK